MGNNKKFGRFIGSCVDFNYRPQEDIDALCEMVDTAQDISLSTFMKHVPLNLLAKLFPSYTWGPGRREGLRFKDDWAISFHRSFFKGKRCYFVKWSAIEFIFTQGGTPC